MARTRLSPEIDNLPRRKHGRWTTAISTWPSLSLSRYVSTALRSATRRSNGRTRSRWSPRSTCDRSVRRCLLGQPPRHDRRRLRPRRSTRRPAVDIRSVVGHRAKLRQLRSDVCDQRCSPRTLPAHSTCAAVASKWLVMPATITTSSRHSHHSVPVCPSRPQWTRQSRSCGHASLKRAASPTHPPSPWPSQCWACTSSKSIRPSQSASSKKPSR